MIDQQNESSVSQ